MARPNTLSSAVDRICRGIDQAIAIPEFLDSFYTAENAAQRSAMMADEPRLTGDLRLDALVGAIGEYLAKRYRLPTVPAWASGSTRFLAEPWFTTTSDDDGMREYLAFTSPAEFRHHNIFTEALPLRRASQRGRDGC